MTRSGAAVATRAMPGPTPSAAEAARSVRPVVSTSSTSTPPTGWPRVVKRGGRRSEPRRPARCEAHSGAIKSARSSTPLMAAIARDSSSAGSTPNRQTRIAALGIGTIGPGGGPHRSTSALARTSAAWRIPSYLRRCTSARAGPAWMNAALTTSPPGRYRSGAGRRAATHPSHKPPLPHRRQARQVILRKINGGGDRRDADGRRQLLSTSSRAASPVRGRHKAKRAEGWFRTVGSSAAPLPAATQRVPSPLRGDGEEWLLRGGSIPLGGTEKNGLLRGGSIPLGGTKESFRLPSSVFRLVLRPFLPSRQVVDLLLGELLQAAAKVSQFDPGDFLVDLAGERVDHRLESALPFD